MRPGLTLPGSLVALRPCFTAPSFRAFCGLAAGLAGQPRRRTVVGMLLGAGLSRAWPHDRAHYFFARARWEIDELGLAVARLAVLLVPVGAPLTVAVDDSLFRRAGRKVYGAGWHYDGSSPAQDKLSFGTCFVVAGIVVRLPFLARPVCLPVLGRLDRHELLEQLGHLAALVLGAGLETSTLFGGFKIDPHTGAQVSHRTVLVRWAGRELVPVGARKAAEADR
jgi:DDE superfamily endonuclease